MRMLLAAVVLGAMACGPSLEQTQTERRTGFNDRATAVVRERAGFELDCAPPKLVVQALGDGTEHWDQSDGWSWERVFAVSGCTRRAIYMARCEEDRGAYACNAILNSEERRAEEAPVSASE